MTGNMDEQWEKTFTDSLIKGVQRIDDSTWCSVAFGSDWYNVIQSNLNHPVFFSRAQSDVRKSSDGYAVSIGFLFFLCEELLKQIEDGLKKEAWSEERIRAFKGRVEGRLLIALK